MDKAVFKNHAKTFSLAAVFFPQRIYKDVASLYAFCRKVDDLVDESSNPSEARIKLEKLQIDLDKKKLPLFPNIEKMIQNEYPSLPFYLSKLIDGVKIDLDPPQFETMDELIHYAKLVASTVGLSLCEIFKGIDKKALPHAMDLGIGMQLTNIARDVYEDAERSRRYLPASYIAYDPGTIIQEYESTAVTQARLALLKEADRYYQSGFSGLKYLKGGARFAVATSALMYKDIGTKIQKKPHYKRAYLPLSAKLIRILKTPLLPRSNCQPVQPLSFYSDLIGHL